MIISRTPFRISFVGGGTDFEDYYKANEGQVISTAINKYIYVTVNHKFDNMIHLRYSDIECVSRVEDLKHNIAREALKMAGIFKGVEIAIISDIPTQGSGLGSSSSLAVGLINALYAYKEKTFWFSSNLAKKACSLEIDVLKSPIGKQDQYASAFGGLNLITFCKDGLVLMEKIGDRPINKRRLQWLKSSVMLFYLNGRSSNKILIEHKNGIESKSSVLDKQKMLTRPFLEWLYGKYDNAFLGELITLSWEFKKQMTPGASSGWIENIISQAIRAGAVGAKLCGAGGGGFLMIICDKSKQPKVRESLSGFLEMEFSFENEGSKIIHAD